MNQKFIQKEDLPETLFSKKDETLKLPEMLISVWRNLLEENNLLELAKTKADKGFEGGVSKEDTNKHLAWRYNGSCGRVILSLLDPKNELHEISNSYAKVFSGGKVMLVDLPSGSGAATISILTTLAELRKSRVLPRIPLEVVIVAGEISETARVYFHKQLEELKPLLIEQAIWIEFDISHWDVLDKDSTSQLNIKILSRGQSCTEKLLIFSNFSGLLENDKKFNKAKLDDIFLYNRTKNKDIDVIWIEPQRKSVECFTSKLTDFFKKLFKSDLTIKSTPYCSNMSFIQPIKTGTFPVRLTVIKFTLPLMDKK